MKWRTAPIEGIYTRLGPNEHNAPLSKRVRWTVSHWLIELGYWVGS